MPACRCPSSTVTTRKPFPRTLLWTGPFKCTSHCQASWRGPRQPSSGARGGGFGARRNGGTADRGARQAQRERSALTDDRSGRQLAAMFLRDLLGEGEAEPGAALLGGEEGIEDAGEPLGRNAGAAVLDLDEHVAVGIAGAHADRAPARHRLARVADEVQEQLADLADVGEHTREIVCQALLERNPRRGQLRPDEIEEIAHGLVEVRPDELRLGEPGVAQILFGDRGEAIDLANDGVAEG